MLPKITEVDFCIDDIRGAHSEDFLYALFQSGKESFQQAMAASIQRMLPEEAQHKKNSYKVVFSCMKESSLFFITYCDNLKKGQRIMTIALDTQVANQLYKKQLALEGKSVKAFEDEMLQEALGKLFDRTSTEYKLFKAVILDYHKQEKVNKRLTEQLQNPTQIVPQVALLAEADMPTPKEQVDN